MFTSTKLGIVQPKMNPDDPLPTRSSLLARVKNVADDVSWEEFQRRYRGLLLGVSRRAGFDENEAEEVVQDTLIAVAKKIPDFAYDPAKDSFKGWLLQILRWKITDQFRKKVSAMKREAGAELSATAAAGQIAKIPDPTMNLDAIWEAEWQREVLRAALARVKRQVKPEQYAIYHLHVVEEHSVSEVCRLLSVSRARVYLAKHRVGRLLKGAVKAIQSEL